MGIRTNRILMFNLGISPGRVRGGTSDCADDHGNLTLMWDPMLKGFAAAVLGGMTSLPGSIFGAYAVASSRTFSAVTCRLNSNPFVAFAIIVLVLCFRPSGLFARHYVKKVIGQRKSQGPLTDRKEHAMKKKTLGFCSRFAFSFLVCPHGFGREGVTDTTIRIGSGVPNRPRAPWELWRAEQESSFK